MFQRSVPRSGGDVYAFGDGIQTEQSLKRVMRLIIRTVMEVLLRPSPLPPVQFVLEYVGYVKCSGLHLVCLDHLYGLKLRAKFESVQGACNNAFPWLLQGHPKGARALLEVDGCHLSLQSA